MMNVVSNLEVSSETDQDTLMDVDLKNYATLQSTDYRLLVKEDASHEYLDFAQGAHGMLFSRVANHPCILMIVRFDGYIGFPGGLVEKEESPVDGLNREFSEEMGHSASKMFQNEDLHLVHVNEVTRLKLFFYVKEIGYEDFLRIEKQALMGNEYGLETFGILRVPIHQKFNLDKFLKNQFIGNTKVQFLNALKHYKLSNII